MCYDIYFVFIYHIPNGRIFDNMQNFQLWSFLLINNVIDKATLIIHISRLFHSNPAVLLSSKMNICRH